MQTQTPLATTIAGWIVFGYRFLRSADRTQIQLTKALTTRLLRMPPTDSADEAEFKVVVTNKTVTAPAIVAFHNGRGSQEGIFAELKSQCHMGHIPVRGLMGNQVYLLAGLFAHNLTRQPQMRTEPRSRGTTAKRAALWAFEQLDSLRHKLICRAGRITHPQGRLTLTISGGREVKDRVLRCLSALNHIPKPF